MSKISKLLMLMAVTAMLLTGLVACGEEEKAKPTLIFGDLDWTSAQIQNAIARKIAETGYGYETDSVFGGTIPLLEALTAGDTNINMELWLPNQQAAWDTAYASGELQILGNSLEDNFQSTFIIPQYVADANPGLKNVTDLPDFVDLFKTTATGDKGRILQCIPGWECEVINFKKLAAYGLEDTYELVNPGSLAALDAEVIDAYQKKENILHYYWGPTTLTHKLATELGGYVMLEEPVYTEECAASDWGCAYPLAEVLIAMRTDVAEAAPEIAEFLTKWDFTAGNQLAAEGYMGDSGADYPDVAVWFLQNTDDWKNWVGDGIADKVLAAL